MDPHDMGKLFSTAALGLALAFGVACEFAGAEPGGGSCSSNPSSNQRSIESQAMTQTNLKPGDDMPDGTIYAGISPDTNKPMYAPPADAPLTYTFNEAQNRAERANAEKLQGHDDWRVPTKNELNVLFNNRAVVGAFNVTGSGPAGWYWSATPLDGWGVWCQRFSDGAQTDDGRVNPSSLRLVR